jgi:hypothetical protein
VCAAGARKPTRYDHCRRPRHRAVPATRPIPFCCSHPPIEQQWAMGVVTQKSMRRVVAGQVPDGGEKIGHEACGAPNEGKVGWPSRIYYCPDISASTGAACDNHGADVPVCGLHRSTGA